MCFARIIRVGGGNGARSTYTRRDHLSSGRRRAGHSSLMPKLPVLLLSLVRCSLPASARPIGVVQAGQPTGVGRVVATITTLEGTVHMPGVEVELRTSSRRDGAREDDDRRRRAGHVSRRAARPLHRHGDAAGLRADATPRRSTSAPARSRRCCSTSQLTFVLPDVEVRADAPSPTDSVQPVSMSDMLSGSVLEIAPLEGDDFQSLLPLLPGVVRGPDGRLRIKGGQPTQGALQISSASLDRSVDRRLRSRAARRRASSRSKCWPTRSRPNTAASRPASRRSAPGAAPTTGRSSPATSCRGSGRRSAASAAFEPRFSVRGPLKRDRVVPRAGLPVPLRRRRR